MPMFRWLSREWAFDFIGDRLLLGRRGDRLVHTNDETSMETIIKKFFPEQEWKFFDDGKLAVSQSSKFTIRELDSGDFMAVLKLPVAPYVDTSFYEVVIQDASLEFVCELFADWGRRTVDHDKWIDEAIALFGDNHLDWRFKCPKCGQSQSIGECAKWGMIGHQPMQLCGSCGHCNPPINPVVIETKVWRDHVERTYAFEFNGSKDGN